MTALGGLKCDFSNEHEAWSSGCYQAAFKPSTFNTTDTLSSRLQFVKVLDWLWLSVVF
jgi:hypothetical protein